MNVLTYLLSLRPAMPTSIEKPPAQMSNGEVRRLLKNKAIMINGDTDWTPEDELPCWVWQLIYFPSATKGKNGKAARRTTIVQHTFKPWIPHV